MITLYELHWSHYCEKIRWALDYKKLPWKKVNINAFTKKELIPLSTLKRPLVPFIYDDRTHSAIGESTSILRYLEETYSESPPLFPSDPEKKEAVYKCLIELDSKLGIIARRVGYTQIILEKPTILSRLFLSDKYKGFLDLPLIRNISSAFLGMMLIKRFRFELNETLHLYEELEHYLLQIADKLKNNPFLLNNSFSAADITLAVYLRPLLIIPFYKEHPELTHLFQWQRNLLHEHKREDTFLYEELIAQNRKKQAPVRRKINKNITLPGFLEQMNQMIEENQSALNDHEPIWTTDIWRVPFYYFYKIRNNKLRQYYSSEHVR